MKYSLIASSTGFKGSDASVTEIKNNGAVHDPADNSMSFGANAGNGTYWKQNKPFTNGLTITVKVKLTEVPDKNIIVKDGTGAWSILGGKIKQEWLKAKTDAVALSADQIFGNLPIPINQWCEIKLSYHTQTGCMRIWVDGLLDRSEYRVQTGELANTGSSWQLFKDWKNFKVGTVTVEDTGTAPDWRCLAIPKPQSLVAFLFDKIVKPIPGRLRIEKPYGNSIKTDQTVGGIATVTADNLADVDQFGSYTLFSGNTRIAEAYLPAKETIMPDPFLLGMYNVPTNMIWQVVNDFGINAVYNDWWIINNGPWEKIQDDLDACQNAKIKAIVRGAFHTNSMGNLRYAENHPATLGYMAQDEYAGDPERGFWNYRAFKSQYPTRPVFADLNNFTTLPDASNMGDVIICNTYMNPVQAYYIALESVKWRPTIITLPQYEQVQKSEAEMKAMAMAPLCVPGVIGLQWFEFSHQKKGVGYITQGAAYDRLKNVVGLVRSVDLTAVPEPIKTGNVNICAAKRGAKTIIVSLINTTQSVLIGGISTPLAPFEVKII